MRRAVVALLLAGCASGAAPVDLTVIAGMSMPDDEVAKLHMLVFSVSGTETASASYPLAHPFADKRQERVVYNSHAQSGALLFTVDAMDSIGNMLAGGQVPVALTSGGAISATVTIEENFVPPDLAAPVDLRSIPLDFAAPDLTLPFDLSGACAGQADGTVCIPTTNPCQNPGVCTANVCGPITNKGAGTVCAPKSDSCHTDGTCDGSGNCGPQGVQPDGFNYDAVYQHRCCKGAPTDIYTDANNCGACGIACRNGNGCVNAGGEYQCACTASSDCWSNCCSQSVPTMLVCVPSSCGSTPVCISCPGGASCAMGSPHYYCHY
jgi:hypothetical protein